MPWIQNVSLKDVEKGTHFDPGFRSMLIQIVDPAMNFPKPKFEFLETARFEFLDLETRDNFAEEAKITSTQANQLVNLLHQALREDMNVIVHCVAGMCRSGAVAEVGIIMGFQDTEVPRSPNLRVKHFMMKELGLTYDCDEPFTLNGRPYVYNDFGLMVFADDTTS